MSRDEFPRCPDVRVSGIDPDRLDEVRKEVLSVEERYCQAMVDADMATLRDLTSEAASFSHMSGLRQTRDEFFSDIADGSLRYFSIGIRKPLVEVDGDAATVTFTSVLDACAYGARGVFRMPVTHRWRRQGGRWLLC